MATSKQCFYDVLGLRRDASLEEIKAAYKRIAKSAHPDRIHVNAPENERARAAEKFKAASEAYEILSDQAKRAKYDAYGFAGLGATSGGDNDSQSMFEQMFGMGSDVQRKQGVVSPTLFVDSERGGSFFQRRVPTADIAMSEAKEALPEAAAVTVQSGGEYTASATLPAGPWEVKLVEVEGEAMTVMCGIDEAAEGEWGGINADLKSILRVSRLFAVPADADALAAVVSVDAGAVSVRMPSKGARPVTDHDSVNAALIIGTRVRLTGLMRAELNDLEGTIVAVVDGARLGVLVDGEAKALAIKRANLRKAAAGTVDEATTSDSNDGSDDPASVIMPIDSVVESAPSKTSRRTSRQRKKAKRAAGKREAEAVAMELEEAV